MLDGYCKIGQPPCVVDKNALSFHVALQEPPVSIAIPAEPKALALTFRNLADSNAKETDANKKWFFITTSDDHPGCLEYLLVGDELASHWEAKAA